MQIVGLGHQGLSKGAQGQLIRWCSGNAAVLSDFFKQLYCQIAKCRWSDQDTKVSLEVVGAAQGQVACLIRRRYGIPDGGGDEYQLERYFECLPLLLQSIKKAQKGQQEPISCSGIRYGD